MRTEDKQKIIKAMIVGGLITASCLFERTEEQRDRIEVLTNNNLSPEVLKVITEDLEDILCVVEEYLNGENTNA